MIFVFNDNKPICNFLCIHITLQSTFIWAYQDPNNVNSSQAPYANRGTKVHIIAI